MPLIWKFKGGHGPGGPPGYATARNNLVFKKVLLTNFSKNDHKKGQF